jgi:hypothetical protein
MQSVGLLCHVGEVFWRKAKTGKNFGFVVGRLTMADPPADDRTAALLLHRDAVGESRPRRAAVKLPDGFYSDGSTKYNPHSKIERALQLETKIKKRRDAEVMPENAYPWIRSSHFFCLNRGVQFGLGHQNSAVY